MGKLKEITISFEVYDEYNEKIMIKDGKAYVLDAILRDGATVLSRSDETPTAYAYENTNGQRFLVYTFDFMSLPRASSLTLSYARQRQAKEHIEWIARRKLPAFCAGCPDLYILCGENETERSIALFNCFADDISMAKIELDNCYSEVEFVGCEGRLDGDRVIINYLPPFGYAAFKLKK